MSMFLSRDGILQSDSEAIQSQGYRVASLIGKGSFGRVYQAYDSLGNEYAIKAVSFRDVAHKSPRCHNALDEFATSKFLSSVYYEIKARQSAKRSPASGATKFTQKKRASPLYKRFITDIATFLVNNGIPLSKDLCDVYDSAKSTSSSLFFNKDDEDEDDDKIVSEKVLKSKNSSERLDYEGVVIIYDVFLRDAKYFLVMERLNGMTLDEFVRNQSSPLPEARVKRYMFQCLKGLNFLWKHGIVHRDIKPENIMFTQRDCQELKLVDIGLGRFIPMSAEFDNCLLSLVESSPSSCLQSRRRPTFRPSKVLMDPSGDSYGEIEAAFLRQMSLLEDLRKRNCEPAEAEMMQSLVGSPFYVSPEVMANNGYSRNCDLWSLGMCFYLMATGKDLVRKIPESFKREKRRIWENAADKEFALQGIASPDLNRILCSMLSKTPRTPEDLLADAWFDECRKSDVREDEREINANHDQPPDDFFPPSHADFNLRSF